MAVTSFLDLATGAVPPGQRPTRRFPVTGEVSSGVDPPVDPSAAPDWRLDVVELDGDSRSFDLAALAGLDVTTVRVDVHCVTGWTRLGTTFTGVRLAGLFDVSPATSPRTTAARFVRFESASARAHDTSLPIEVAFRDTWVVWAVDGVPLPPANGGPLRTVTPSRYFYKSLKWVRRIELLAEDRPGYWERTSSYHNNGDPWAGDERFTSGSLRPEQVRRFLDRTDYTAYRGRVVVGVDLRTWRPATRDLRELSLKGCDLRAVDLHGADLRGVNLSLSDLRDADLRGADLRDGDIEGADFAGADLRGADLRRCAASATNLVGGRVAGVRWDGVTGLLEDQEAWLRSHA